MMSDEEIKAAAIEFFRKHVPHMADRANDAYFHCEENSITIKAFIAGARFVLKPLATELEKK